METRFGIKDLFLFGLIGALLLVVGLAMWQFDRQFEQIGIIKQQNKELTGDVSRFQKSINSLADAVNDLRTRPMVAGPVTAAPASSQPVPAIAKADAFTHINEAEKQPGFARGDWLIDNFGTKIGRITPLVSTDIYQVWVESQVMEPLADRDPQTLDYVPRLASRWEVSPDGLRMKFWLRSGITFSDGEPLTADDVLFTFNWIQNPDVDAARARGYLSKLKSIKKIDDLTVEFVFSEFFYLNFSTVATASIMPQHFYSKYTPQEYNEKTGLLLGSGPYKLESSTDWTPTGGGVTLVRNDRYWGTAPTFNRIVFREMQGEKTQDVAYGNQAIDIVRCLPDQYKALTSDPRVMAFSDKYEFDNVYGGYRYCAWNQLRKRDGKESPTPFADKRVRQAMTMLLDRERICKDIYMGFATPASGPFAPTGPQSAPDVKPWPHDEVKAKALLVEAGFSDRDGDGVIEGQDGKPFKFKLTYPSGNETTEKVVLFAKDSYARAGIIMEPDRVDWPVLVQKLKLKDFDAIMLGYSSNPESDQYQVFHSSQIAGQGDNRVNYINKDLDHLIEKARTTVDTAERMKVWQAVHRILNEDQPFTFLFVPKALRVFNKRIHNIEPAKIGLNFEYLNGGLMPWYVPKPEQKYVQ